MKPDITHCSEPVAVSREILIKYLD
jgi:hypothetical protein